MEDDGFVTVKGRKRQHELKSGGINWKAFPRVGSSVEEKEAVLGRLNVTKEDLSSSDFCTGFFSVLSQALALGAHSKSYEVVCYGLGRFSDCTVSRYQFALLLLLKEKLQVRRVWVYDPVFDPVEKDVLESAGCEVIEENEEGKRRAKTPTIFYLPHCPKQLINNILWANWDRDALRNCVLIGSAFGRIVENTPRRILEQSLSYVLRAHPYVTELGIVNSFKYTDIFNDTSVHVAAERQLSSIPTHFWMNCGEPEYSSERAEFVTKADLTWPPIQ